LVLLIRILIKKGLKIKINCKRATILKLSMRNR